MDKKKLKQLTTLLKSKWTMIAACAIAGLLLNLILLTALLIPAWNEERSLQEESDSIAAQLEMIEKYQPPTYITAKEAEPLLSVMPNTLEMENFTSQLNSILSETGVQFNSISLSQAITNQTDLLNEVMQIYNENIQPLGSGTDTAAPADVEAPAAVPSTPGQPPEQPSIIGQESFDLEVSGTLEQLSQFMDKLHYSPRIVDITQISLRSGSADNELNTDELMMENLLNSDRAQDASAVFTLELNMTIYYSEQFIRALELAKQ